MKKRDRSFDIFSLSFLDVISCGFGAVVMLILVSKPDTDLSVTDGKEISALLNSLVSLRNAVTEIQQSIGQQLSEQDKLAEEKQTVVESIEALNQQLQAINNEKAALADSIAGLSLVEERLQQAALQTPHPNVSERDDEVGGIPVDSDYVVFIVDTSGSMKNIWRRVSQEIINVLNIHPQVKGFQILNDMGHPIISGYDGQWIEDTPGSRKSVIDLFANWGAVSNSSPVEGLEVALRKYAKPNITTSIYVFGDDYSGGSYDNVVNAITEQNRLLSNGQRLAKIHAVGFISPGTTQRFSVLMREVTQRNGGTFIALPR